MTYYDTLIGNAVGNFEIQRELGRGGLGEVFERAKDFSGAAAKYEESSRNFRLASHAAQSSEVVQATTAQDIVSKGHAAYGSERSTGEILGQAAPPAAVTPETIPVPPAVPVSAATANAKPALPGPSRTTDFRAYTDGLRQAVVVHGGCRPKAS